MDIAIIPEEAHNGVGLYLILLSVYLQVSIKPYSSTSYMHENGQK